MNWGDMIDKLMVMIEQLAARDSRSGRQFKLQIYQGKRRGQNRGSYDRHSYDQRGYQNRYRSDSGDRRQYRKDRGRPRFEQNYRGGKFRSKARQYQNYEGQDSRGEDRNNNTEMKVIAEVEIGTGLEKGHFLETLVMIETIGVQAIVGPGQGQGQVQIETESDVTSVGNMIIFAKDCPASREERELEQLQQMHNLDGEQTSLKSLTTDTHDNLNKNKHGRRPMTRTFKLIEGKKTPLHFYLSVLT